MKRSGNPSLWDVIPELGSEHHNQGSMLIQMNTAGHDTFVIGERGSVLYLGMATEILNLP